MKKHFAWLLFILGFSLILITDIGYVGFTQMIKDYIVMMAAFNFLGLVMIGYSFWLDNL